MKMKTKLTAIILVLCIAITVMVPALAEETSRDAAQSQIERAVVSYAANGTRDHEALAALASLDPSLGEKWTRIMDLWEAPVSLSVEAGVSVSETVRRILTASGTGIRLLSFPGRDPVFSRGQAFCGRTAECVTEALSAAGAKGYLVPAGLCILPAEPLPATLDCRHCTMCGKARQGGCGEG